MRKKRADIVGGNELNNEQMALYKSPDIIFVFSAVIFNILVSVVYISTKLDLTKTCHKRHTLSGWINGAWFRIPGS